MQLFNTARDRRVRILVGDDDSLRLDSGHFETHTRWLFSLEPMQTTGVSGWFDSEGALVDALNGERVTWFDRLVRLPFRPGMSFQYDVRRSDVLDVRDIDDRVFELEVRSGSGTLTIECEGDAQLRDRLRDWLS